MEARIEGSGVKRPPDQQQQTNVETGAEARRQFDLEEFQVGGSIPCQDWQTAESGALEVGGMLESV